MARGIVNGKHLTYKPLAYLIFRVMGPENLHIWWLLGGLYYMKWVSGLLAVPHRQMPSSRKPLVLIISLERPRADWSWRPSHLQRSSSKLAVRHIGREMQSTGGSQHCCCHCYMHAVHRTLLSRTYHKQEVCQGLDCACFTHVSELSQATPRKLIGLFTPQTRLSIVQFGPKFGKSHTAVWI